MLGDDEQTLSFLKGFPARTNVLVVDFDLITLIEMEKTMRKFSYQVLTYPEADKAIAYLTNCAHEINLVIWNLHMPKINGLEALKIIGSSRLDLPVVIMSDDNQTESVMQATIHGACDYVMKPVSEKVITNLWQHIVRKKMMSKSFVAQPVESDLVPSHGLVQANNDPMIIRRDTGEHTIYMEDQVAMRTDLDLPLQSDVVETNNLHLDDDDLKVIYEDNGEQNINKDGHNASTKPQRISTDSTQSDQSNVVMTDGLDLENGERNMDKKAEGKLRMARISWTSKLHNKFLEAIDIIGGMEKAKALTILKVMREMNIKGLNKDKVSSHLQKHRKNLEKNRVSQLALDNAYRPPSLLGSSNAHTDFGQFPGYGVYGPSSLLDPSNAYTAGPSVMNCGDMNQYQYPNGYLTANSNNQFMTSPVPTWPYSDDHQQQQQYQQQQQQQQQEQFPQQMGYLINNQEPEEAYADDIELIYPELPYDPNEYLLKGNNCYQ